MINDLYGVELFFEEKNIKFDYNNNLIDYPIKIIIHNFVYTFLITKILIV